MHFTVKNGGQGYTEGSKVFFEDADGNREQLEDVTITLAAAHGESHDDAHGESHGEEHAGAAIGGLAIGGDYLKPFDDDGAKLAAERERLAKGKIVIEGGGSEAVIEASLLGISKRIRDQFLFLISGIVLLTLLVNATTIKFLVNGLGLTRIPAVKAKMMTATSASIVKNCENEMDVLKSDSFLGGANWSRVRDFLPQPIVITDVEGDPDAIDTVAETRRRILEKGIEQLLETKPRGSPWCRRRQPTVQQHQGGARPGRQGAVERPGLSRQHLGGAEVDGVTQGAAGFQADFHGSAGHNL